MFDAYGIPVLELSDAGLDDPAFDTPGPAASVVNGHPEQTYLPKISSRVLPDGGMESNPLQLMSPDLDPEVAARVHRFINTHNTQTGGRRPLTTTNASCAASCVGVARSTATAPSRQN